MMGLDRYKASPFLLKKIMNLCRLLWKEKRKYEYVASTIPDKELRRTVLSLAQESNQYASELSSQIETLGGIPQTEIFEPEMEVEIENIHDENDVLAFCKKNEKKMVKAYTKILNESYLNESYLYDGLEKMMRYQLNGILCAFMQLKLLNSLKFHKFREHANLHQVLL